MGLRLHRGPTNLLAALAMWVPFDALADDRHRDARARHDRAAASSDRDRDRSDRGRDRDDTPCPAPDFWAVGGGAGVALSGDPLPPPIQLGGELWLEGFASPASIGGAGGVTLRGQQGWGGGFALGGAFYEAGEAPRRVGLAFALEVTAARLLNAQPIKDPNAKAPYTSTLDLVAVEAEIGPEYRRRFTTTEAAMGVGFGITAIRSNEQFSDGFALGELLAFGARARPYLRVGTLRGAAWGAVFGEAGAALFLGSPTRYAEDYDSLVAGLSWLNLTPRARLGYRYPLSDIVGLGVIWDGRLFGAAQPRRAFAQRILLSFSLDLN